MRACRLSLVLLVVGGLFATGPASGQTVTIDRAKTQQGIDGFGLFGGKDVYWSQPPFFDAQWLDLVIDDLGITIHRSEYFSEEPNQDASWADLQGLIQALDGKAEASKEPLKFIWTVWSPPSQMKSNGSLKNGGELLASQYDAFGNWLVQGIDNYTDLGVDLYALSPQNEPLFSQFYNSCVYSPEQYRDMLKAVGPIIRAAHPMVKIFGPEHMLFGVGKDWDWENLDPTKKVLDDPLAAQYLDLFACHGYGADGATPTAGSEEAQMWSAAHQHLGSQRPIWMTETSGYPQSLDGALDYALSIHAALAYGQASGWVHWTWKGDSGFVDDGGNRVKSYYVAKQFYRFVRPGAARVEATVDDEDLFVTAFDHGAYDIFTVVLINAADGDRSVTLAGSGLPSTLTRHRTSAGEDCVEVDTVDASASIDLPAKSITTLVSGDVYGRLGSTPPAADAGIAAGDGALPDGPAHDGEPVDGAVTDGGSVAGDGRVLRGGNDGCGCSVDAGPSEAPRGLVALLLLLALAWIGRKLWPILSYKGG